ncbi:MAG: YjbQ family protein [Candidatus Bipolaricaulis sp.]|nr:YjbQ family protein [Candidatus Bipolaricaulis sp.]MDD5219234.1 YjbQ family protein [Candidatus Bipolaricaulis sp.]MDD5647194.1 YjbQ family protein [Candidatus Bipolaricaulis sp.]
MNIAREVENAVCESEIREGPCLVDPMHTTSSVFVNDDERGRHTDFDRRRQRILVKIIGV